MNLESRVIEESYGALPEELDEDTRARAKDIVRGMPEPIRDLLNEDHFTEAMIKNAMNETFTRMEEQYEGEMMDGAAIFAKGLEVRIDGS